GALTPLLNTGPANIVRVSPSGGRLLVTRTNEVQIWELNPPSRLAVTNFSSFPASGLHGAAWHPGEQLIVLGPPGGLFLWHWSSGAIEDCAAPKPVEPFDPFFNATGNLLFLGGQVWDVASQTLLLSVGADVGSVLALSRDEQRVAYQRVKTGFGVWEFLPPLGTRTFLDRPLPIGSWVPQADVSADGRHLASTHADGWRVWEIASGRVVAQGAGSKANVTTYQAKFTTDGKQLITVDRNGLNRWQLPDSEMTNSATPITVHTPATILAGIPSLPRGDTNQPFDAQMLASLRSSELITEHGCITTGGRFAALSGNGYVVVGDLARTNFAAIRLRHNDVEFTLSPDGCWLVTGRHNRASQDVWEVATGRHFLEITNPFFPTCHFHPSRGELAIWNNNEFAPPRIRHLA
ncbi:MAG: hypothetical protein L0Z50_43095, partial [Verrucomicrobiales bacterium]|nr:hypothetical protein [Verrucomicrobiales bacterium]